ncbi:MAG TPA: HEAT repeat domain-containing protein [Tepidisphaeraceae bacterium]|jgi:HEAT repeat protein
MASDPARLSKIIVIAMIIVAVGGAATLSYFMHARSTELAQGLDSPDPDVVNDNLIALKDRHDPIGMKKATSLLQSDNTETRVNAAIYLGALDKKDSVPYLIKAMREVEDDRKDEIVSELAAITGQAFGRNANGWRDWWLADHPADSLLFNSPQTTPSASMPSDH